MHHVKIVRRDRFSTHSFNPKGLVTIKLAIDCLKFIPIKGPRLAKLLTLGPVGNKASPLELACSIRFQNRIEIGDLAFLITVANFLLHLLEAVNPLDDVPIQS